MSNILRSLINKWIIEGILTYGRNYLTGEKFEVEYAQYLD
ncbi:conserved hypothetical protein (plasmid) ['Nostoc azollae' 0708]|uniref:Uncharacterized protein n=1 Tax=Nostoc azollae (strain 0708) TaxID=551115 RepID=D7E5Q6_NOSA0|nr:conserved hypothetical protein ['Nostoc azollae' 0708]